MCIVNMTGDMFDIIAFQGGARGCGGGVLNEKRLESELLLFFCTLSSAPAKCRAMNNECINRLK